MALVTSTSDESVIDASVARSLKLTTIDIVGGIYCHHCHTIFPNKSDYDTHYLKHNIGTEIIYTCVICQKNITGYPSFRGHCYTSHVIKNRYKCEYCKKLFSKQSALQLHIQSIHKFICPNPCNKEFPSKKELQLHQIIHNEDTPPYNCKMCDEQIETIVQCEHHIEMHSEFIFSCPICSVNITDNPKKHLSKHYGDADAEIDMDSVLSWHDETSLVLCGGILCSICKDTFKNKQEFDAHWTADHSGDVNYSCTICGWSCDKYPKFGYHVDSHATKNKFHCDICGKQFARLSLLVMHTEAFHGGAEDDKPFRCQHCNQKYAAKKSLDVHMRDAHGRHRQHVCMYAGCGDTFETPKDMILHLKNHKTASTSENWCRQCGLQLTTLLACIKHLAIHKKKLYSCPICEKKYSEKYLTMNHIPQHFEAVLHICKACGKVFNSKQRFVSHSKIHSTKMNTCSQCGKSFATAHQLRQHLHIHSGFKYKCVACPRLFSHHSNWHKHIQKIHFIDPKTVKAEVVDPNDVSSSDDPKSDEDNSRPAENASNVEMESPPAYVVQKAGSKVRLVERPAAPAPAPDTYMFEEVSSYEMGSVKNEDAISSTGSELSGYREEISLGIDPSVIESEAQIYRSVEKPEQMAPVLDHVAVPILPVLTSFDIEEATPAETTLQPVGMPCEYGPDFINKDLESSQYSGHYIDLDDHLLPHIDPMLTIKDGETYGNVQNLMLHQNFMEELYEVTQNWEPPIISKCETTRAQLSLLNGNLF